MLVAVATSLMLAFQVPMHHASLSATRTTEPSMIGFSKYYQKWFKGDKKAATTATSDGGSMLMSVQQACAFYASNPDVEESEKTAFLQSKGVSEFVIAQASCTATGMEKTVAGHPPLPGEDKAATASGAGSSMTVAQACAFYAANPDVDEAEKTAFLKSQGVSDFVIAQGSCTATGMEKTVAGHP